MSLPINETDRPKIIVAGIDYSITSPAIVIHNSGDATWDHRKCKAFYFDDRKNAPLKPECELPLKPQYYPLWTTPEQRYQELASWAVSIMLAEGVTHVYLEEYAFSRGGGAGLVFNIAENGGVLKNNMWFMGLKYKTLIPSNVKYWATGKGNAKKDEMEDRFVNETEINDLRNVLWLTEKAMAPISDIIDAYYICKIGHFLENKLITKKDLSPPGSKAGKAKMKPLGKGLKRKSAKKEK